jgi:hypothetical protein
VFIELFPSSGCCTVACLLGCYLGMGLHVTVFSIPKQSTLLLLPYLSRPSHSSLFPGSAFHCRRHAGVPGTCSFHLWRCLPVLGSHRLSKLLSNVYISSDMSPSCFSTKRFRCILDIPLRCFDPRYSIPATQLCWHYEIWAERHSSFVF